MDKKNLESDMNYITFCKLIFDSEWFRKNEGKYICIVNGKVVGINKDESKLLNIVRSKYSGKNRYFAKIEKLEEKEYDIPSSLEINLSGLSCGGDADAFLNFH